LTLKFIECQCGQSNRLNSLPYCYKHSCHKNIILIEHLLEAEQVKSYA